jgi:ADP-ribosylglycohydrolase
MPSYVAKSSADLWADAVLVTAVTRNDPAAIGASVAFANMFFELLSTTRISDRSWWVKKYVTIASQV